MIETFRLLLSLFGHRRRRWMLLAALAATVTLSEAVSAALVYALIAALSTGEAQVPLFGTIATDDGSLGRFAIACGVFFVARGGVVVAQDINLYRVAYREGAELEERLLRGYLDLPIAEQRRRGHGDLVRNVHDSVITVVEGALIPLLSAVALGLKIVAIVGVMLVASPLPTLAGAVVVGPAFFLVSRLIRPRTQQLGADVEAALSRSLGVATETLRLALELRLAGQTRAFSRRFGDVRRDLAETVARQETISRLPMVVGETILVLFVVGYLSIAGGSGDVLPTVGLFAYAALRVLPSLLAVVKLLFTVHFTRAALETVAGDVASLEQGDTVAAPWPTGVRLRGVVVQHEGTSQSALDGIDLDLSVGEVVALVGPNGAGKSTLAGLLTGTVLPTDGTVTLDGSWAGTGPSGIAVVNQHVHLLDADVFTNVTLELDATDRDDGRAHEALEQAGFAPVLAGLPAGTATVLGDDGCRLSGGERQRVAIARALYRNCSLLVIDEGTSALDADNRSALGVTLTTVHPDRLTVLVTHDRALAARCSRVIVLDAGRVVADGVSDDVLAGAVIR